jgi:hypothetical protein
MVMTFVAIGKAKQFFFFSALIEIEVKAVKAIGVLCRLQLKNQPLFHQSW